MTAVPATSSEAHEPAQRTRLCVIVCIAVTLLTLWRISLTHTAFVQTNDEAAHIACGMEWLDRGVYEYEAQHPPLARVAAALLPYLSGVRSGGVANMWEEGREVLYSGGNYSAVLALARLGVLPFFAVLAAAVTMWGWMLYGRLAAVAALIALCSLPVVLGHASVATTDMAFAATFCLSLLAVSWWLRRRDLVSAAAVGITAGLSLVSKFSFAVFFPPCALALLALELAACRRPVASNGGAGVPEGGEVLWTGWRPLLVKQAAVGLALGAIVVFATYRFALKPLRDAGYPASRVDIIVGSEGPAHDALYDLLERPIFPFTDVLKGFYGVYDHVQAGHRSGFLGEVRQHGVWYYYPVMLAVKTPLAFLALGFIGAIAVLRNARRSPRDLGPLVCAGVMLLCALPSTINIGVRHVLPFFPLLTLVAGFGVVEMFRRGRAARFAVSALLGVLVISGAAAHPDYIGYYNVLADDHAAFIGSDSDLDWGQYVYDLKAELDRIRPEQASLAYFGSADLSRHDLPPFHGLSPYERVTGWVAISPLFLMDDRTADPPYTGYAWLREYEPVSRAGRMLIYYIPPEQAK